MLRQVLFGEALCGLPISDAASLEQEGELSTRVQTLADSAGFAYALRGGKRSEPARLAARFVMLRIPGVPDVGR